MNKVQFCKAFSLLFLIAFFCSCNSTKKLNKDYLYFQNDRDIIVKSKLEELTIKPNDLLIIQIFSKTLNQEQAAIFNITAGQGYLVGLNGRIEIPVIGEVTANGLTRYQLQESIRSKLVNYVKEPSVLVRFQQFQISVLGEVRSPGTKPFPTDKVTIIDAISAAGDLTETGVRENVLVSREDNNGVRKFYEIDLRSAALFSSPVYQLQQNDIVYVNANKAKLKELKEKGTDAGKILQIGLGVISVATSLFLLFRR